MSDVLKQLLKQLAGEANSYYRHQVGHQAGHEVASIGCVWCNIALSSVEPERSLLAFFITADDVSLVFHESTGFHENRRYAGGYVRISPTTVELFVEEECIPHIGRLVQIMAVGWNRVVRYRPAADLGSLTVMTWNIEGGANEGRHVVCSILSRQPDIVCLQEVTHRSWVTMKAELMATYPYVVGPVFIEDAESGAARLDDPIGLVVLSLYQLHDQEIVSYRDKALWSRGFVSVRVRDWPLFVICTHLDSSAHRSHYRQAQVQEVSEFVRLHVGCHWIIVGDMNCAPGYPEYGAFSDNGWVDAATFLRKDPLDGFTEDSVLNHRRRQVMKERDNTNEAHRLVRFDQMHFRGAITPLELQTIRDPIALSHPPYFTFASDHFAVMTSFSLLF
jgi:endonuclease/exonuclease/phosphatase family metal-dependent hydrolase